MISKVQLQLDVRTYRGWRTVIKQINQITIKLDLMDECFDCIKNKHDSLKKLGIFV